MGHLLRWNYVCVVVVGPTTASKQYGPVIVARAAAAVVAAGNAHILLYINNKCNSTAAGAIINSSRTNRHQKADEKKNIFNMMMMMMKKKTSNNNVKPQPHTKTTRENCVHYLRVENSGCNEISGCHAGPSISFDYRFNERNNVCVCDPDNSPNTTASYRLLHLFLLLFIYLFCFVFFFSFRLLQYCFLPLNSCFAFVKDNYRLFSRCYIFAVKKAFCLKKKCVLYILPTDF